MEIVQRVKAPTPNFFKKLRNIGLVLAAVGAAIVTAPISLPAALVTAAGYAAVTGSVIGAVSQLTTKTDSQEPAPANESAEATKTVINNGEQS